MTMSLALTQYFSFFNLQYKTDKKIQNNCFCKANLEKHSVNNSINN